MKKTTTVILFLFLFSTICFAQNIVGEWSGALSVQGIKLHLSFHIEKTAEGYTTKFDSHDQGVKGAETTSTSFANAELTIKIDKIGALYTAKLANDTLLEGTFTQMGNPLPLNLIKKEFKLNRPQEPKKPYPYREENIIFSNKKANIALTGTLTLPKTGNNFAAIVLVAGSGKHDRDGEIMGHKPFLLLANYLTQQGIAVLRYDKRGVHQSEGNFEKATSNDFAHDAMAAIAYLKSRAEINPKKIGIVGHSEGGMIAIMNAAKHPKDIAYIVSMGGIGVKGEKLLLKQVEDISRSMGMPQDTIKKSIALSEYVYGMTKKHDNNFIERNKDSLIVQTLTHFNLPINDETKKNLLPSFAQVATPWFRYFLQYDPAPDLQKIRCPMLALNGDKDIQVNAAMNLAAIKENTEKGGNKKVTVKTYIGLNHLFQTCKTCQLDEYAILEETIAPQVLSDISNWILTITR